MSRSEIPAAGPQEADRINLRIVLACGAAIVAVTALSSWAASAAFARRGPQARGSESSPAPTSGPGGMLERSTFDQASSSQLLRAAQSRQLASYGWVDPDAGLVHIPIDRAMVLSAGGLR